MSIKLTIGMCTNDDYRDIWWTIEALKTNHDLSDCEILVLNSNNIYTPQEKHIYDLYRNDPVVRMLHVDNIGTSGRGKLFDKAKGEFVLVIDSHVMLEPGVIDRLKNYIAANPDCTDLLQGPLSHRYGYSIEMSRTWKSATFGVWKNVSVVPESEETEIDFSGLGLFCCKRDAFAGFAPDFYGWGGEELYLHEKFRRRGDKCISLNWLVWNHRDRFPGERPTKLTIRQIFRNFLVGRLELGLPTDELINHFVEMMGGAESARRVLEKIKSSCEANKSEK